MNLIPPEIDITIRFSKWNQCDFDLEQTIQTATALTLAHSHLATNFQEKVPNISILLCDDGFIQTLNKEYRGQDKATNVLSFPQIDFHQDNNLPDDISLGDILLAYQTIKKESIAQDKTLREHLTHLIIHGVLHLIGYDHQTTQDAHQMEALEITILEDMGIKNPYLKTDFMA